VVAPASGAVTATPPPAAAPASTKPSHAPDAQRPLATATATAPAWEALTPRGQGAAWMAPAVMLLGAAAVGVVLAGAVTYNAPAVITVGLVLALYGLSLSLPRRSGSGDAGALLRAGRTAKARSMSVVRRDALLGPTEWWFEYDFEATDGLEHHGRFRITSPEFARQLSREPGRARVRYSESDPAQSVLTMTRAAHDG
jgi:hypothetical protein